MQSESSKPLIYLASPYWDPQPSVRAARYEKVKDKTAELIRSGSCVFSPIVYSHPMSLEYSFPERRSFWLDFDLDILAKSDRLMVYCMPGWGQSQGVAAEITFALDNNIPVEYIPYELYPNQCDNCED